MAAGFALRYPISVGTNWTFSVAVDGQEVVITGSLLAVYKPTYAYLGF